MVNSSNNSGYGTKVHLEVEIQNNSKGNLYHYAVFPITSKGIIDSRAMKGSVLVNGKNQIQHL